MPISKYFYRSRVLKFGATGLSAQSKIIRQASNLPNKAVRHWSAKASCHSHRYWSVGQRPNLRLLNALEAILVRGQNVRIVVQDLIYKKPKLSMIRIWCLYRLVLVVVY